MFSIGWPTEMLNCPLFCCSFVKTWENIRLPKITDQTGRQLAVDGISSKVGQNNERNMSAFFSILRTK